MYEADLGRWDMDFVYGPNLMGTGGAWFTGVNISSCGGCLRLPRRLVLDSMMLFLPISLTEFFRMRGSVAYYYYS
jgi:hypothetical protein